MWLYKLIRSIRFAWMRFKTKIYYRFCFQSFGKNSVVYKPMKLSETQYVSIGDNVEIWYHGWLLTHKIGDKNPQMIIEDGTCIGHFAHVTCSNKVHIGKKVLIADRFYMADHYHGFSDINTPIIEQPVFVKKEAGIGDGSWIGENVCIISAKVGKHCVIGANSVVTKDIPDYSVAAGAPAKVIKKFDFDANEWVSVK